jgi:enolase
VVETRYGGIPGAPQSASPEIAHALLGCDASCQAKVDQILIELDGIANNARLGGNALVAVSMAALHAAAAATDCPLYVH